MLDYLLVLLVVPLLRRAIMWLLVLLAGGFLVTVPARLWTHYIDSTPDEAVVIVLNVASACLLIRIFAPRGVHRRRRRRHRNRG